MTDPGTGLSRDAILGGRLTSERRASRVLATIEARVTHMRRETRRAVEALFLGREVEFTRSFGDDYLRSLKLSAALEQAPGMEDIERFARQWRPLVPPEPEVRADAILAFAQRYAANPATHPGTFEALGFSDPAVRTAFAGQVGVEPAAYPFSEPGPRALAGPAGTGPDEAVLREAEQALEWVSVPAGTELIRQGDAADYLYFVVSGRLRVFLGTGGGRRPVADLGRGELVGEIAVLTGEPRTADVVAMRDSEVVRLPQEAVLQMAHHSPQMLLRVNQILARRLRVELSPQHKPRAAQVAIAVIGSHEGYSPRPFAERLVASLRALGPVAHVSRSQAEQAIPRLRTSSDPSQDAELLAWLSEQEALHRYVVFEAGARLDAWTDLCLRQADRVAVVADAAGPSTPGAIEQRMLAVNREARRELVLVHPESVAHPTGTAAWLRTRDVAAHHHVKLGDPALIDRAARRLAGQAIGLVLGGGGARGYAHIGAWQAFEELGIPVDAIGGDERGRGDGGRHGDGPGRPGDAGARTGLRQDEAHGPDAADGLVLQFARHHAAAPGTYGRAPYRRPVDAVFLHQHVPYQGGASRPPGRAAMEGGAGELRHSRGLRPRGGEGRRPPG